MVSFLLPEQRAVSDAEKIAAQVARVKAARNLLDLLEMKAKVEQHITQDELPEDVLELEEAIKDRRSEVWSAENAALRADPDDSFRHSAIHIVEK